MNSTNYTDRPDFSLMNLAEALSATNGQFLGNENLFSFNAVTTDSRTVSKNCLFVPLVGTIQDGHKYVPGAVESGASVILINKSEYEKNSSVYDELSKKACFLIVENTLYGLQNLAEGYVAKFPNLIKVAVTGSSGKTTTKEMLVSVLKQKYNCVYTKGNFNSETGLPLSVFQIRSEHECGIFEMGMNRENEIGEISKVLKAEYAVISNIGNAHIGILKSRENIAREKRKIFDWMDENGVAFVPVNDDFVDFITENVRGKVVKFGASIPKEVSGAEFVCEKGLFGLEFTLDGLTVNLPVSGKYNYQNALSAAAVGKALGLSAAQIKAGLESFVNVGGRMEVLSAVLKNGKKATIVKDCYNANPDSMEKVIQLCLEQKCDGNKILVLGDMKELGENSHSAHKAIAELVKSEPSVKPVFIGSDFASVLSDSDTKFESVNAEGLASYILDATSEDSVILLKGSNSMKLWELLPLVMEAE